jgi:CheY-like chemotaxis protein
MAARVLVLDDQEYLRDVMATILNDAGYVAEPVATTGEAWERLADFRPDLLVLDLALASVNGSDFLERLRAEPAWERLPVLAVSGDPSRLNQLQDRPHVAGLLKPFDVTALVAVVASMLESGSLPARA